MEQSISQQNNEFKIIIKLHDRGCLAQAPQQNGRVACIMREACIKEAGIQFLLKAQVRMEGIS